MEPVVAVALIFGPGVVLFDAADDSRFGLLLGREGYYCCCSASDGTSGAGGEVVSCGTVVLGKMDMAVDAAWCNVAASCVDDQGIVTSG